MVGEIPVRVCLDELRDSTEPGAVQALARERRIALLGTAGVMCPAMTEWRWAAE